MLHTSVNVEWTELARKNKHEQFQQALTLLKTKTGMFSMMMRFTVETSLVRTQYLVVERLKACAAQHSTSARLHLQFTEPVGLISTEWRGAGHDWRSGLTESLPRGVQ